MTTPLAGSPAVDAAASQPVVELERIHKRFGQVVAIHELTLNVEPGEVLSLLGPSGCGKTTTLRIVAGLEQPTSGSVRIRGASMVGVPPHKRNLGMVPQNYALFPHMTVFENVAFGLRMHKVDKSAIPDRVRTAMELVQLQGMQDRLPRQLSGGQQQRVALARAIVIEPTVLLLDEPLGALDRKLRQEMQVELKQLQARVGVTTIFVSHDQEEALTLSDRVVVMNQGRIQQVGRPRELYEQPATHFVADFLGVSNFLRGRVAAAEPDRLVVETEAGPRLVAPRRAEVAIGQAVELSFRPEKVALSVAEPSGPNRVQGTIESLIYLGNSSQFHLRTSSGARLIAFVQNAEPPALSQGDSAWATWSPDATQVFPLGG